MSRTVLGILLLAAVVLQAGVINQLDLRVWGVCPFDLFLTLALVCGLLLPRDDARLAALLAGLACDLTSVGPFGQHAVALAVAAAALTAWRDALRTHLLAARIMLASSAGVIAQAIRAVYVRVGIENPPSWTALLAGGLLTALVAGVVAGLVARRPAAVRGGRRRAMRI